MANFESRAERYRQRAEELLTMAEDFRDPKNKRTLKLLAEEYVAMANRLEGLCHDLAEWRASRADQNSKQ